MVFSLDGKYLAVAHQYKYVNPVMKDNKNQDPSYMSVYKRKGKESLEYKLHKDKIIFETLEKGESD
jgi:hypothetical protein